MNLRRWLESPFLDERFPLPLDAPFTTRMALAEGVTKAQLTALCRDGHLRRPIKGVYLACQVGDSIRLRAACLALVAPSDAVVCDRHAGWLAGAEMVLAPNEHLDLRPISMFRPSGAGRLRNTLADSGERNLIESDLMEIHGVLVTTPIRTTWDLGRLERRDRAFSGMDAMMSLGVDREEFLAGVERFKRMRWIRQLRTLAPWTDARSESPGESVLRLRWLDCALPTPTPQIKVYRNGEVVARLDMGHEPLRFAAEYDGAEWHSSPEQRRHDRERRGWLDRDFDWVIEPMTSVNVFGQLQDCHRLLHEGISEARRRQGRRVG